MSGCYQVAPASILKKSRKRSSSLPAASVSPFKLPIYKKVQFVLGADETTKRDRDDHHLKPRVYYPRHGGDSHRHDTYDQHGDSGHKLRPRSYDSRGHTHHEHQYDFYDPQRLNQPRDRRGMIFEDPPMPRQHTRRSAEPSRYEHRRSRSNTIDGYTHPSHPVALSTQNLNLHNERSRTHLSPCVIPNIVLPPGTFDDSGRMLDFARPMYYGYGANPVFPNVPLDGRSIMGHRRAHSNSSVVYAIPQHLLPPPTWTPPSSSSCSTYSGSSYGGDDRNDDRHRSSHRRSSRRY